MSGNLYPEEFKIQAIKQVVDRGHSIASVSTRLDRGQLGKRKISYVKAVS
ncbi:transposase [Serratia nevei]|nr:transposase [Serratia nevei]WIJ67110.1 transposase [Serratia nevei]